MAKAVVEEHRQIYHYTNAKGLQGIVESQQLWATNIAYLNDVEEHTGFFDRKLPRLLEEQVRAAFAERAKTELGRKEIDAAGGLEKVIQERVTVLGDVLRRITLKLNNPYVVSFCSAPKTAPEDGLLSQWRGYGSDGGYAVVFETEGIQELLEEENKRFYYQSSVWGDVEYYDQDTSEGAAHDETREWEKKLKDDIRHLVGTGSLERTGGFAEPITALSCMHKHRGFAEETEVRIAALPANTELFERAHETGEKRPRKPINFSMRNGVLVPYIKLFGHQFNGKVAKLPISKVIVGPHPEKRKRQKAVEFLLEQNEIEATVTVSEIPYIGR